MDGRTEAPDETAVRCLRDGLRPTEAIKVLRTTGLTLGEAKEVVHRNLQRQVQASAELLWDAAEDAVNAED